MRSDEEVEAELAEHEFDEIIQKAAAKVMAAVRLKEEEEDEVSAEAETLRYFLYRMVDEQAARACLLAQAMGVGGRIGPDLLAAVRAEGMERKLRLLGLAAEHFEQWRTDLRRRVAHELNPFGGWDKTVVVDEIVHAPEGVAGAIVAHHCGTTIVRVVPYGASDDDEWGLLIPVTWE